METTQKSHKNWKKSPGKSRESKEKNVGREKEKLKRETKSPDASNLKKTLKCQEQEGHFKN